MATDKETGSYYTPPDSVDFMIRYLIKEKQDFSYVLEPSAGDGRFLSALLPISKEIDAIEIFEEKVADVRTHYKSETVRVMKWDFLEYSLLSEKRYSLIVGNPPYISLKAMKKEEIDLARKLCEEDGLQKSIMQNMWLAFVVGATRLLRQNGSIFFVLPMEFLQVQYAERLRMHLEKKFNTVHIITFQKRIFPDIEQEVCFVYLTNKKGNAPNILYETYFNTKSNAPVFRNRIQKNKPLKKWSNAILQDKDILFLKGVSQNYKKVKDMGESAPGIVTGGNKYFILTEEQVKKYDCLKYTFPILAKSSYIGENTIIIDDDTIEHLKEKKKPLYLLNLSEVTEEELPERLKQYLSVIGEEKVGDLELKKRYKCANRDPWYGVPIVNKGDVVFFRRYHIIPRVYINQANVYTTDAGYHMRLNKGLDKNSLVFCLYNSLTLAQCEFQGRYYGGGVSELMPSEFKELPIPYRSIENRDVKLLDQMFREKRKLDDIVTFVNSRTLAKDMRDDSLTILDNIRKSLMGRRIPVCKCECSVL